ncbi:UDP-glycosyltransferase [Aestuariibaculum sediminum]|uniref:UDP-glycosyltransferase n=1 Tax=Aestuariibaculum sediminum TaxID=2770637 RepID=A0A8J6U8G2_9FLAO|nr:UDP-glycosyltransferase [Aestuariibaculum sediminum]MBD0833098.1 UDP-glycosyltransferase [Aestuariibaculum sediminum]
MKKKVFVFFPDGVGLRNFAFTNFKTIGAQNGFDVVYWNNTVFDIEATFGFDEVRIENTATHPLLPQYTRARKRVELNLWTKKFKDDVYQTYKFPFNYKGIKNSLKSLLTKLLIGWYGSEKGIEKLRQKIEKLERTTSKYTYCKKQLKEHKPDLVFCTTQRATQAISALLAAKDLGIPVVTFVYSWDNVPKAMQVVETDYYCVWSDLMKAQMLQYYPYINESQIFVTGTPQFEPHFDKGLKEERTQFFKSHNLDLNKKYICYSGDDETTSPLDQYYLEDLVKAVRKLNADGYNLGVIYRKCPVDFTSRYDKVLFENKDVITVIDPIWKQIGKNWNTVLPDKEDFKLLYNVCEHTELVTNVCSSTVFDFVLHNKSCIYYNYEQPQLKKGIRDIGQNYKYVHFRSMPSKEAAVFCESKVDLEHLLKDILDDKLSNVEEGLKWFEIVAGSKPAMASESIWEVINKLI